MASKDSFTAARAETLARTIARYWRNRGYNARVWIEPVDLTADEVLYQIRSDMVGGLPVKTADQVPLAA